MINKRNLIFIGAPGAGKGTFSALLLQEYPLAHISTGDILRDEIKRDTELGRQAAGLMKEGKLVPDDVVAGMVRNRLQMADCDNGFILDGFPRTIKQAELLDEALKALGKNLDAVVYFQVEDDIILQRLTARISCKKCGEIYNKLFMPPKEEGVCDKCGGELFQRPDDSLETAQERLKVFYANTPPLIDFYGDRGLIVPVTELEKSAALNQLKAGLA